MKPDSLKPWSLLEDSEQSADFDAVTAHAAAEAADVGNPEARADSVLDRLLQRFKPSAIWAVAPVALSTIWLLLDAMLTPSAARWGFTPYAGIVLLNLVACAVIFMAHRLSRQDGNNRQGESNVRSAHAGLDPQGQPLSEDLQPVWQAVERHTENIQHRLNEVLEEHSRMNLELSLATSQKRQAATILDVIPDAVLVTDAFEQLVTVNAAAEELFRFSRRDSLRKPVSEFIQDNRLLQVLRQVCEAEPRASKRRIELEVNGRVYVVAFAPLIQDTATDSAVSGRHGVVVVFRDYTKERDASRVKSDFVANAAHELRTPLSAISAYIEMLVDGEGRDEKTRTEYYNIIQTSAHRLGRMIDNILNISRIEAGTVRINKSPVAISLLVKQAVDTMLPKAEQSGIQLTQDLAPVVDRILCDRDLIEQAVLNLISNAIKYTPKGGKVHVRTIAHHDQKTLRIEVSDSGAGIPKTDLPRIFEKFFRVEANNKLAAGTGLGLSLVRQIVETVHGGEMSLESEVGKGSIFTMILPLYEGE